MIYYRVRKEYDNFPQNPRIHDGNILIGGELFTEKEFNKLPYVYAGAFERVEIPKNQTYWFFGARFAEEGEIKKMTIAEQVRNSQNTKEMTRRAIQLLECLGEDVTELKNEFSETYKEGINNEQV